VKASLAAALLLTALLAGCSKGGDSDGSAADAAAPLVLFLNVTAGNQTYRATGGAAPAHSGSGSASASASASATVTSTGSGSSSHGAHGAAGNATKGNGNVTGNATPVGPAPFNVTVTVGASGLPAGKAFTWAVDFGDSGNATGNKTSHSASPTASTSASATGSASGSKTNGTSGATASAKLPATLKHTYAAAGNHTIRFTLTVAGSAAVEAHAAVRVTAAANATGNATGNATTVPPPEVTHFEFGQSLGCTGDLPAGNTCQDYADGPPGSDTDGHWIALGPSYWGWTLTSTVDQGNPEVNDSDCIFVDEALAAIGDASNGGDPCTGEVPDGAAWVFLYPYALPALGMTADFVPTA
jgi:hypothetical protein